jgi:2-oxoisovalerate dehydrogenase E2 component (dihydrolipoyl transacylase)
MGEAHVIKLPDVGEGVAEAELVEWHVKVGDLVREDMVLAAVMTDKATVEIPSPVDGEVLWLGAEIGDTVAVGSPLVRIKVAGEGRGRRSADGRPTAQGSVEARQSLPWRKPSPANAESEKHPLRPRQAQATSSTAAPRAEGEKPLASPAVRLRARRRHRPASGDRHRPGRPHHP